MVGLDIASIPPRLKQAPLGRLVMRIVDSTPVGLLLSAALFLAGAASPDQLPSEVKGVVGSGNQLSLKLKTPGGERTLRIGEAYGEGWTLEALTPSKAILTKDGVTREIGLNPTGAVASDKPDAPPSKVTMIGLPDEGAIEAAVNAALAKNPNALEVARQGGALTLEEARRQVFYQSAVNDEIARREAADPSRKNLVLWPRDETDLLGEAAVADRDAMFQKATGFRQAAQITDLAARPVSGPTSYYVPAGADARQIWQAAGIDERGVWLPGPLDAQGGRTVTQVAGTAEQAGAYFETNNATPKLRVSWSTTEQLAGANQ
ncbi:MAG: hypothetical protein JWM33_2207 [Caulobacteraceae bacterium]|nr:hypothetical protein [Caulobacteraceae bacterium]